MAECTHRLVKLISLSNFSRAIAMVCRRVYATLILIGQSNLDRPIRADGTKHRDTMKTKHRDWIEKCFATCFFETGSRRGFSNQRWDHCLLLYQPATDYKQTKQ